MSTDAPVPLPRKPLRHRFRRLLALSSSVVGAVLVSALGCLLTQASFSVGTFGSRAPPRFGWLCDSVGEKLARLSYDLPFTFRGPVRSEDACIVYLDEKAGHELRQRGSIWDRSLHTQLLQRLTADHARAALFDIVFSEEWPEAKVDDDFAAALKENGHVFLAGAMESDAGAPLATGVRIVAKRVIAPIPLLRRAAAGWGLIEFDPIDGDYGIRRMNTGAETVPSATWRMAEHLGAEETKTPEARAALRWMNYYGPAGSFPSIAYDQALEPGLQPGFFKDRIVFIGGRSTLAGLGFGKDDYRNPYAQVRSGFSTGVEVHLTALLNLLGGEWLTRLDERRELWFALATGLVLGAALPRFRPHIAALIALAATTCIGLFACWIFAHRHLWFAWCVPAFVQVPVALTWAIGARYFLEERRRIALRSAFGHYLSPHIADRIADADFDLNPGGAVVEASVLFTDLEGFTPLAEKLDNPQLVSGILVEYFTQTTKHILGHEGTILNFVGDAVTAVWGAPLADPAHARKAALAACRLHESARISVGGHMLRTRVGLHTGRVLAGNIGSAERFDYAVVGDPVNFASRLEGLNKYLGTNVLVSDVMRQQLGDEFVLRALGDFRVLGRKQSCVIHELLGTTVDAEVGPWFDLFECALTAFRSGDLDSAERFFHETLAAREGDGPAQFYLAHISKLRRAPLPLDWAGVVEFAEK